MKRRITNRTLENKIKKWQKCLKLDGWTINAKFVPPSKLDDSNKMEVAGQVQECSPDEKVVLIYFHNKYYKLEGYGISWNIDTLILHELIHVLCWEKVIEMPTSIQDHSKFQILEEFVCNSMAKIIFDNSP